MRSVTGLPPWTESPLPPADDATVLAEALAKDLKQDPILTIMESR